MCRLDELLAIEGFDEEMVDELRTRAKDVLLTQALSGEEIAAEPAKDLLELEGMNEQLAQTLASHGIITREDLAEQSVDDISEFEGLSEELAAKLIMKARAHWFEKEETINSINCSPYEAKRIRATIYD